MSTEPTIWQRLRAPFPADDVEWRIAQTGKKRDGSVWAKCLAYITNRAVMDRLDEVVGPENWKNEFAPAPDGGTLCGLSLRVGDEWITKWDGAAPTDIEGAKGAISGAMKRAAVQYGVGRYLYDLPEGWAEIVEKGAPGAVYASSGKGQDRLEFYWRPPSLPSWALPGGSPRQKAQEAATPPPASSSRTPTQDAPSVDLAAQKRQTRKSLLKSATLDGGWDNNDATVKEHTKHCLDEYGDGPFDLDDHEFDELIMWIRKGGPKGDWPEGYVTLKERGKGTDANQNEPPY